MKIRAAAVSAALVGLSFTFVSEVSANEIRVRVKNCMNYRIGVWSYNPNDSQRTIAYESEYIRPGDAKNVKCQSQGKGYCHLFINKMTSGDHADEFGDFEVRQNVDKNKWVKVYRPTDSLSRSTAVTSTTEPSCD